MFRDLLVLRDQISKEFHEPGVDVSIANGNRMTIKFINSPFRSRSREEKQQRADAVAAFVVNHYREPLSSVSVEFVRAGFSVGETYVGRPAPKP